MDPHSPDGGARLVAKVETVNDAPRNAIGVTRQRCRNWTSLRTAERAEAWSLLVGGTAARTISVNLPEC